jgi:hypothetical protein
MQCITLAIMKDFCRANDDLRCFALFCREGVLFTLGNPLLDISAEVDNEFLNK